MPVAFSALLTLALILSAGAYSCGDDGDDGGTEEMTCDAPPKCASSDLRTETPCTDGEDCTEVENECGDVRYCRPDPTCEAPCPEGSFEVVGATCDDRDETCQTVIACGGNVVCRDVAACLAESACPDTSPPRTERCDTDDYSCIPVQFCGQNLYCPALSDCADQACDTGEVATTTPCGTTEVACRELEACGERFYCHCGAAILKCEDNETQSNSECQVPAIKFGCRTITGCGTFITCREQ